MSKQLLLARYETGYNVDEVLELLEAVAEATRREEGNHSFEVFRSADDPSELLLVEEYADNKAIEEHRASDHFVSIILGKVIPLLISRTVTVITVVDSEQHSSLPKP